MRLSDFIPEQFRPRSRVQLLTPPGIRARLKPKVQYGLVPVITRQMPLIVSGDAPMVRVHYEDGAHSKYHIYNRSPRHGDITAIETVAFDEHGILRFSMLKIR